VLLLKKRSACTAPDGAIAVPTTATEAVRRATVSTREVRRAHRRAPDAVESRVDIVCRGYRAVPS
jgi:hypothetical protein